MKSAVSCDDPLSTTVSRIHKDVSVTWKTPWAKGWCDTLNFKLVSDNTKQRTSAAATIRYLSVNN